MKTSFRNSVLMTASILVVACFCGATPSWANDYYVASGGMFRRVSFIDRREKEKEKFAFVMGLCVGQVLAQQQISVPLPQTGQVPTPLPAATLTALQSAMTTCKTQLYGSAQTNPGNGPVNSNPGNGPGNGPVNNNPSNGTVPVNPSSGVNGGVPGSDTGSVQGAVSAVNGGPVVNPGMAAGQNVYFPPADGANLVQSGLDSSR